MQSSSSRRYWLAWLAPMAFFGLQARSARAQDTDAISAKAQLTDVYSVKFLCGTHVEQTAAVNREGPVKPGNYLTAINVHNPNGGSVVFRKKAILMFRDDKPLVDSEVPMPPNGFRNAELRPNWGLEIDCADIRGVLLNTQPANPLPPPPPPPAFIKGWVVIEVGPQPGTGKTPVPLDVTAVYTAHGYSASSAGAVAPEGFSIDVVKIEPTQVKK